MEIHMKNEAREMCRKRGRQWESFILGSWNEQYLGEVVKAIIFKWFERSKKNDKYINSILLTMYKMTEKLTF